MSPRDAVVGAGFLVAPRTVFTCAHVVAAATTDSQVDDVVRLDFVAAPDVGTVSGAVVALVPSARHGHGDVAVIVLDADAPAGTVPAQLGVIDDLSDHSFETVGFPFDVPLWARGRFSGAVPPEWLQIEATSARGYIVQRGFSGAPVLDVEANVVVGLVVAADRDAQPGVGWAVSIEAVLEACPPRWRPLTSDDDDDDLGPMERYLELVLAEPDVANLSTPFGGVPASSYMSRVVRRVGGTDPIASIDEVVHSHDRTVVIGGPGMGKSELLHDLARSMASGELPGIPVLVRLRGLAEQGVDSDLVSFALEDRFADRLDTDEVAAIVSAVKRSARDGGRVVFLFDGLDEVSTGSLDGVLARIRRTDRFVLTSRPAGRIDVLQDVSGTYSIEGLSDRAIARFVNDRRADRPELHALLDQIHDDPGLAELARVPQFLVLLCSLWGPGSSSYDRGGLLSHASKEAVDRAARSMGLGGGDEETLPRLARRVLRRLALDHLKAAEGHRRPISRDLLVDMATDVDAQRAGLLAMLVRRSGLLVGTSASGDEFEFLHQTFRDFLAAEAIAEASDPAVELEACADRPAAEECLILLAALDPTRMPWLILDRLAARQPDIFGIHWYVAALCLRAVPDLDRHAERVAAVEDAVIAGAREWWGRARFTIAIGCLRSTRMRAMLLDDLHSDDGFARWSATEGLRRLGDASVAPALRDQLVEEEWPAIISAIALALAHLRDPGAADVIWEVYQKRISREEFSTNFYALGEAFGRLDAETQIRALLDTAASDDEAVDALIGARPFVGAGLEAAIDDVLAGAGITFDRIDDDWRVHSDVLTDESRAAVARVDAARRLGWLGDAQAAKALVGAVVEVNDEEVRDAVAWAVVQLDGEVDFVGVMSWLCDLLLDDDEEDGVRAWGAAAVVALWVSPAQTSIVERIPIEATPELIDLLGSEDRTVVAAAAVLAALGQAAPSEILAELIDDDDPVLAAAAAAAAGWAEVDEATPALVAAATSHHDGRVRVASIRAIGSIGPQGATDALAIALSADHPDDRAAAARALGLVPDATSLALLTESLAGEVDSDVVVAILDSVAGIAASEAVDDDLIATVSVKLESEVAGVRAAAARAMAFCDGAPTDQLYELARTDPSEDVRDDAAKAFGYLATEDQMRALVEELGAGSQESMLVDSIAYALERRQHDHAALTHLGTLIEQSGGAALVTERAIVVRYPRFTHILVSRGKHDDVDELREELRHSDPGRRWDAVDALADYWTEGGVIAELAIAMLDEHPAVADRAAAILSKRADEYVITALSEEDLEVLGDEDVMRQLISLLELDDTASSAVAWVLAQVDFLPPLMRSLLSGNVAVRQLLWSIGERWELRLMSDGRAILASGESMAWDEVSSTLRS